jgi:hypothetical protein
VSGWDDCSCVDCRRERADETRERAEAIQNPYTVEQEADDALVVVGWDPNRH